MNDYDSGGDASASVDQLIGTITSGGDTVSIATERDEQPVQSQTPMELDVKARADMQLSAEEAKLHDEIVSHSDILIKRLQAKTLSGISHGRGDIELEQQADTLLPKLENITTPSHESILNQSLIVDYLYPPNSVLVEDNETGPSKFNDESLVEFVRNAPITIRAPLSASNRFYNNGIYLLMGQKGDKELYRRLSNGSIIRNSTRVYRYKSTPSSKWHNRHWQHVPVQPGIRYYKVGYGFRYEK